MHSEELQLRKNECQRFSELRAKAALDGAAISLSSRISVSDAPSSRVDRREEKLFVSEINFNDGVEIAAATDRFETLEIHNPYEGE
jgi:hypothetical protein